jgi:hypothetical protein
MQIVSEEGYRKLDTVQTVRVLKESKVSVRNLRKEMHIKSVEDSLCIKRLMWLKESPEWM